MCREEEEAGARKVGRWWHWGWLRLTHDLLQANQGSAIRSRAHQALHQGRGCPLRCVPGGCHMRSPAVTPCEVLWSSWSLFSTDAVPWRVAKATVWVRK